MAGGPIVVLGTAKESVEDSLGSKTVVVLTGGETGGRAVIVVANIVLIIEVGQRELCRKCCIGSVRM